MPWELRPIINASRMSSSRYCSALTAWKVQSFESNLKPEGIVEGSLQLAVFESQEDALQKRRFFFLRTHALV